MFGSKLKTQIDELTARCAALEGDLEKARADLEAARAEGTSQADALAEADAEKADLQKQLKDAQEESKQLKATLDETAKKLAAALEDKRRAFAAQLPGATPAAKPAAYADAVDGEPAPVTEGTEASAETWEDALARENGSYAAARQKHPGAYAAKYPQLAAK